jgi:hypothetical protein
MFSKNLPSILGENYVVPAYVENPETVLAKENALEFLDVLKTKIKCDHFENMEKIKGNHEEIMKSLQYQAVNNYVSGLNSSDRLKIDSVESLPYVWEKTWWGFERKAEGITLKVNSK